MNMSSSSQVSTNPNGNYPCQYKDYGYAFSSHGIIVYKLQVSDYLAGTYIFLLTIICLPSANKTCSVNASYNLPRIRYGDSSNSFGLLWCTFDSLISMASALQYYCCLLFFQMTRLFLKLHNCANVRCKNFHILKIPPSQNIPILFYFWVLTDQNTSIKARQFFWYM